MNDIQSNNLFPKTGNIPNKKNKRFNSKALVGATIGTAIPISLMLKQKKIKNPMQLEYGLKDMVVLSTSSIAGGMIGGMYKENSSSKKNKLKEGMFQLLNSIIPTVTVAGMLKLCEKNKKLSNIPCKITAVMGGIGLGMLIAIKAANKIFDPKNLHPDRKIGIKDFLANSDDAIGALALAKIPIVNTLKMDKVLPFIYGYCGYRAGKAD
jgi:hypothetical protein